MTRLLGALLIVHLLLSGVLLLTMDMDVGGGGLRRALDSAIDAYEVIGLGVFPIGLAVLAAALAALWFWRRKRM